MPESIGDRRLWVWRNSAVALRRFRRFRRRRATVVTVRAAGAALALTFGMTSVWFGRDFAAHQRPITGVVTAVREVGQIRMVGVRFETTISYRTPTGEVGSVVDVRDEEPAIGQWILVHYDPRDPGYGSVDDGRGDQQVGWAFVALGFGLGVWSGVAARLPR